MSDEYCIGMGRSGHGDMEKFIDYGDEKREMSLNGLDGMTDWTGLVWLA